MIFILIRIIWEWLRRAGLPLPALPRLKRRTTVVERLLLPSDSTPAADGHDPAEGRPATGDSRSSWSRGRRHSRFR
jgi:hypothetical protein